MNKQKRPMMKIRDRVLIFVIPFLLLGIGAFSTYSHNELKKNLLLQMETDAQSLFQSVKAAITNMEGIAARIDPQEMVKSISLSLDIFEFRFIDAQGMVKIAMLPEQIGQMDNSEGVKRILAGSRDSAVEKGERDYNPVIAVLKPVSVNDELLGIIDIALDASDLDSVDEGSAPTLEVHLVQQAQNIADIISKNISDYYNIRLLVDSQKLINRIVEGASGIRGFSVISEDGVVVLSSDEGQVGGVYKQALHAETAYFGEESNGRVYIVNLPMGDEGSDNKTSLSISLDAEPFFQRLHTSFVTNVVGSITILTILTFIIVFVVHRITLPLNRVSKIFGDMAKGDLTQTLEMNMKEREVHELALAFNLSVTSINGILDKVRHAVSRLVVHSKQLSDESQQMSRGAGSQSDQIKSIAQSAEEISVSTQQVAALCHENAVYTQRVEDFAKEATEVIANTIAGMKSIDESLKASSETLRTLEESVAKIEEITEIIGNIAGQTNLLSLNAAIEAARAGDHGRGFAVVADEVRSLANHTEVSTREIDSIVANIKGVTDKIVVGMRKNIENSSEKMELATKANDAISNIIDMINKVVEKSNSIAQGAEEESRATEMITSSLEQFHFLMKAHKTNLEHITALTGDLDKISYELDESVSKFKVY